MGQPTAPGDEVLGASPSRFVPPVESPPTSLTLATCPGPLALLQRPQPRLSLGTGQGQAWSLGCRLRNPRAGGGQAYHLHGRAEGAQVTCPDRAGGAQVTPQDKAEGSQVTLRTGRAQGSLRPPHQQRGARWSREESVAAEGTCLRDPAQPQSPRTAPEGATLCRPPAGPASLQSPTGHAFHRPTALLCWGGFIPMKDDAFCPTTAPVPRSRGAARPLGHTALGAKTRALGPKGW